MKAEKSIKAEKGMKAEKSMQLQRGITPVGVDETQPGAVSGGGVFMGGEFSQTAAVFTIAVAAELTGLHPQTLRAYERQGLLSPVRTTGGARRYDAAQVRTAQRCAELSMLGMSVAGMALVLALEAENARLHSELSALREKQ